MDRAPPFIRRRRDSSSRVAWRTRWTGYWSGSNPMRSAPPWTPSGWAGGSKEKLIFERGDHNTIMTANETEYYQAVARFVSADSCARKE